jgi:hypothetical protein
MGDNNWLQDVTSTITFGMVFSTTWLEFKDMAQDPLVRRETVSNCSCWQTSIGQPVLFEYVTGCEWHPSNPYGGGSVMVWGCISHDCKLDLVTIQGNLTGDQYTRDVLQPVVVPHFDNHPLATRPANRKKLSTPMFFWNDKWYDLLGHYIGCKKPPTN